jgi:organic radical activating enzyme
MVEEKKYYYSEIFHSIQGEGHYTGVPTAWIRFFLCNLQCNGFGQKDPTDPSTYELPFENFDVSSVKRVEDLPVWDKGCDSSYTWAKKFKGLMGQETPTVLADKLVNIIKTDSNPEGKFLHPLSKQHQHLCFTGGWNIQGTGKTEQPSRINDVRNKWHTDIARAFQGMGKTHRHRSFL